MKPQEISPEKRQEIIDRVERYFKVKNILIHVCDTNMFDEDDMVNFSMNIFLEACIEKGLLPEEIFEITINSLEALLLFKANQENDDGK